ncbi:MAG: WD40 repeat domain-containing protein [Planctomycetia bacterium]|nr:WD40 repeat domain-containing protein [Planctomycetia bacterium]
MAENFNPYREWLGIPESQLPANHYRLLGLEMFESDVGIISRAADKQMVFLRTFQTGKYSAESQKLLNEVSAARICLLNPARKLAYDATLRQTSVQPVPAQQVPVFVPPPATPTIALRTAINRRKKPSSSPLLWCLAAGLSLLLLWMVLSLVSPTAPVRTAPQDSRKTAEKTFAEPEKPVVSPSQPDGIEKRKTVEKTSPEVLFTDRTVPEEPLPTLVSVGRDGTIFFLDTSQTGDNSVVKKLAGESRYLRRIAFAPNGRHYVVAVGQKKAMLEYYARNATTPQATLDCGCPPDCVRFTHDGKKIVACCLQNGTILVFDVETKTLTETYHAGKGQFYALAISPDDQYLAVGGTDTNIYVVSLETGETVRQFSGHTKVVNSLVFLSNDQLVSGSQDGTLRIWSLKSRKSRHFTLPTEVRMVVVSPDGKYLACGGNDGVLRILRPQDGEQVREIRCSHGAVWGLQYSPQGRYLAVSFSGGSVLLVDTATETILFQRKVHQGTATDVAIFPKIL